MAAIHKSSTKKNEEMYAWNKTRAILISMELVTLLKLYPSCLQQIEVAHFNSNILLMLSHYVTLAIFANGEDSVST